MEGINKYDVSIVIPCYQEEGHIANSIREICHVMNKTHYRFEIIFVDDVSTDTTREKIIEIAKVLPNARYFFHTQNTGKGGAIASGAKMAQGKFIGHIDIDLEVSAEYIPALLSAIEKGADIALIKRKINISKSPDFIIRDIAGSIHRSLIQLLLKIPRTDVQSGCKIFKRDVLLQLLPVTESKGWFFDVEILTRGFYNNYRIVQLPGYFIRNKNKKSTVNIISDGIKQIQNLFALRKKLKEEGII